MTSPVEERGAKTVIGILASHDDPDVNKDLTQLLKWVCKYHYDKMQLFHFLFTGGTFERVLSYTQEVCRTSDPDGSSVDSKKMTKFIKENSTRLPKFAHGGVTILTNFVVQRQCSIIWMFLSPNSVHWLNPENLALMRICDTLKVRRFFNSHSVKAWLEQEVDKNYRLNPQRLPLELRFGTDRCAASNKTGTITAHRESNNGEWILKDPFTHEAECSPSAESLEVEQLSIALIAHDRMKAKILDFALEYEYELSHFNRILATYSTGQAVQQAVRSLRGKICLCRSGPLGGDIEIATEILYGRCHVVVFFLDPQSPHPHIEDVRTLIAACMRKRGVLMFTNEEHARDWMNKAVRPCCWP